MKPEAVTKRCSIKKAVLKHFAKFTGKHLCQSLFFNEIAGLVLGSLFHKVAGLLQLYERETSTQGLQFYLKRDSGTGVFL